DIRVGRFPFIGNGKAIALGEDQGLVKVIFDKNTGALLGAHMVGAEVTELIQGYVVAMNLETTEEELIHTVFPHPTLSEVMKEAVLDAYGRVPNIGCPSATFTPMAQPRRAMIQSASRRRCAGHRSAKMQ